MELYKRSIDINLFNNAFFTYMKDKENMFNDNFFTYLKHRDHTLIEFPFYLPELWTIEKNYNILIIKKGTDYFNYLTLNPYFNAEKYGIYIGNTIRKQLYSVHVDSDKIVYTFKSI